MLEFVQQNCVNGSVKRKSLILLKQLIELNNQEINYHP